MQKYIYNLFHREPVRISSFKGFPSLNKVTLGIELGDMIVISNEWDSLDSYHLGAWSCINAAENGINCCFIETVEYSARSIFEDQLNFRQLSYQFSPDENAIILSEPLSKKESRIYLLSIEEYNSDKIGKKLKPFVRDKNVELVVIENLAHFSGLNRRIDIHYKAQILYTSIYSEMNHSIREQTVKNTKFVQINKTASLLKNLAKKSNLSVISFVTNNQIPNKHSARTKPQTFSEVIYVDGPGDLTYYNQLKLHADIILYVSCPPYNNTYDNSSLSFQMRFLKILKNSRGKSGFTCSFKNIFYFPTEINDVLEIFDSNLQNT